MKKITAIEPQKKNPSRVSIYLDGEFSFGLSRIVAAWLKVGQLLSEEKANRLIAEDAREVAMQRALHFLSFRPRSSREVKAFLEKHEIPEDVIDFTLQRLQETNLLNDTQFAQNWVESRKIFRPKSRKFLAFELRQKGLQDELIQQILQENVDESALALDAARKYERKLQGLTWQNYRQKLTGFLGRRGFSYEISAPVVRTLWNELHSETERTINDEFDDEEI